MSKESTEQGRSGRNGAEAAQTEGAGGQPQQGSQRTELYGSGDQEPKHHFAPGHPPSEQGDKSHPSPQAIKENQQGLAGSGTGHHGAGQANTDQTEEIATRGEQGGGDVRHGRQETRKPGE